MIRQGVGRQQRIWGSTSSSGPWNMVHADMPARASEFCPLVGDFSPRRPLPTGRGRQLVPPEELVCARPESRDRVRRVKATNAPGHWRNRSGIRPTTGFRRLGIEERRRSLRPETAEREGRPNNVPLGPRESTSARITASAPPSTQPRLLSELWTRRRSPASIPRAVRSRRSSSCVMTGLWFIRMPILIKGGYVDERSRGFGSPG